MTSDKRTVNGTEDFLRIDFHTHVLPSLDHGSSSVSQSLRQLARIGEAKVKTLCATSHFYPHATTVDAFLDARREACEKLISATEGPRPHIILGAEVLICEGLEDMYGLEKLCFEGTNLLLLELPLGIKSISADMYETVFAIRDMGFTPVLAHVDRYPRELIAPLVCEGIYAQVNAENVSKLLMPGHIKTWIEEGFVVAIGSDYHYAFPKGVEAYERFADKRSNLMSLLLERTEKLLKDAIRR